MNLFNFFHYSFSFRPAIYSYKTTVKKNILVQIYKVEKARTNEKSDVSSQETDTTASDKFGSGHIDATLREILF